MCGFVLALRTTVRRRIQSCRGGFCLHGCCRVTGLTHSLPTLVIACAVAACRPVTGPLPPGAEPFEPPAVYARWWAMTEACSHRSGDLEAVRWYRAPGREFMFRGQPAGGVWSPGSNRIVLAENVVEDGPRVRHEMLHALLRTGRHPRAEFLGACALLLVCDGLCLDEAGWRRPQDYAVLPPDSLDIDSRAELAPREADGARYLTALVTVRNPRGRAVLVAAPGNARTPPTFGYDLRGPAGGLSGGLVATDSSTLFFQPFETKGWLFEFRVGSERSGFVLIPGAYRVSGGYARRWSAYDTVTVIP
jgi:hypothetical protein